jgi:hypothetical protein
MGQFAYEGKVFLERVLEYQLVAGMKAEGAFEHSCQGVYEMQELVGMGGLLESYVLEGHAFHYLFDVGLGLVACIGGTFVVA